LPPTIRILAWCPNPPPNFSARFDCRGRTYRYFFTNPPYPPRGSQTPALLDIDKMNAAAALFVGLHDFRNVCKIDASKQITNFTRRVHSCVIKPLSPLPPSISATSSSSETPDDGRPKMYYLELTGSAFLWHQVRHMNALLFLI